MNSSSGLNLAPGKKVVDRPSRLTIFSRDVKMGG